MKNLIILILIIFFAISTLKAQYYTTDRSGASNKKGRGLFENWKERVYFGGNVGFSFPTKSNFLYIEAAPLIGYQITDKFSIGNTFTYIYLRQTISYSKDTIFNSFRYNSHIFGISPYTRMFLADWVFIHAEYNLFSGDLIKERETGPDYLYTQRGFISYPLLGGGFVFNFGRRSGIMLMALYNPVYDAIRNKFPIYNSPLVFRLGFFI